MRILHTADLHLGMKFSSYADKGPALSGARFTCLERMVATAAARDCDLFVVAGDLFDRTSVGAAEVKRALAALAAFPGVVAVLPGNHDCLAPGAECWELFRRGNTADNVLLLDRAEPLDLADREIDVVLYPAPCAAKHSAEHVLGWIKDAAKPEGRLRIGVAHGDVTDTRYSGPDAGKYFPVGLAELESAGVDLWLLGHNHNPRPESPSARDRVFYAGTPEPDGFDRLHGGTAWILEIAAGAPARAELVETGTYRFVRRAAEIRSRADLDAVAADYAGAAATLLELELSGSLPGDDYAVYSAWEDGLRSAVFHLAVDARRLFRAVSARDVDGEFAGDTFPHRLLGALLAAGDAEGAQLAYELLTEGRR